MPQLGQIEKRIHTYHLESDLALSAAKHFWSIREADQKDGECDSGVGLEPQLPGPQHSTALYKTGQGKGRRSFRQ